MQKVSWRQRAVQFWKWNKQFSLVVIGKIEPYSKSRLAADSFGPGLHVKSCAAQRKWTRSSGGRKNLLAGHLCRGRACVPALELALAAFFFQGGGGNLTEGSNAERPLSELFSQGVLGKRRS